MYRVVGSNCPLSKFNGKKNVKTVFESWVKGLQNMFKVKSYPLKCFLQVFWLGSKNLFNWADNLIWQPCTLDSDLFCISEIFNATLKTGLCVQNYFWICVSRVVNPQRLFCIKKTGVKYLHYLKRSVIQNNCYTINSKIIVIFLYIRYVLQT